MSQPDIDTLIRFNSAEILAMIKSGEGSAPKFKQALYQRLAAEAVEVEVWEDDNVAGVHFLELAIPLSKLKAIMEIKEL